MAVDQSGGAALALTEQDGTPREVARYLGSLKPVLTSGTDARAAWVRFLNEVSKREDLAAAHSEAHQIALGQGQNLDQARRQLASMAVPTGFEEMHRAIDRWLTALIGSCEAVVQSRPPLSHETLAQARQLVYEAGLEADTFNRQRQTVVASLAEHAAGTSPRPRFIANPKELRALAIGLVVAMAMVGGTVYGMTKFTAVAPVVAAPAVKPTAGVPEKRVFPQTEVLARLKNEISTRKVAFNDPEVQLVAPDRIIIKGRIQGPTRMIPVESELQMLVSADGKPRVESKRLAAVGVQVPTDAFDALTRRVEEANKTLLDQVPAGYAVRRLYVENNAVVADLESLAPPAAPKPAAGG